MTRGFVEVALASGVMKTFGRARGRRTAALVFGAAVLVGACGSGSDSAGSSTGDATTTPASSEAAAPAAAPILATSTGGQLDFGDLAGQDAVLWFWAPW